MSFIGSLVKTFSGFSLASQPKLFSIPRERQSDSWVMIDPEESDDGWEIIPKNSDKNLPTSLLFAAGPPDPKPQPVFNEEVNLSSPIQLKPVHGSKMGSIIRGKLAEGIECQKINYSANLESPPQRGVFEAKEVYIGDAHGNTLRIIYDLVYSGSIKISSDELWKYLIDIMSSADQAKLTDEQYNNFIKILFEDITIIKDAPKIVFLGDLLSDRQSNDILTLVLLHMLKQKGLQYKIILSNHDLLFLRFHLLKVKEYIDLYPNCGRSLLNYAQFCKIGTDEEIARSAELGLDLLYGSYLSNLEIFDYKSDLKLFVSHATVGMEQIKKLFVVLKIFELYMALDVKKEKNILNINDSILKIKKDWGENFGHYFQSNYKDQEKIKNIYQNFTTIFNDIKGNEDLFKLFIQLPEIINFCENRTISNFYAPFPGAETVLQGHDLRPDYFLVDLKGIFPPYMPNLGGYVRHSLDNTICKDGLMQTMNMGANYPGFLVIL